MTCPCGEPTPDTATVGPACRERYERDLGDIPALVAELDLTLSRQTASGERVGGRSSEKPMPYDVGASEALGRLRVTLVGWVQVLHEAAASGGTALMWPADNFDSMSRWLLARSNRVAHHEAGGEIVAEVRDAVEQARRSYARRPAERAYAGPCGGAYEPSDHSVCGADLYARVGAATCICPQCGTEYDVATRRQWLKEAAEEMLLTTGEIPKVLPVVAGVEITRQRLKHWAQRKGLVAHGVTLEGWPLYRVGDVQAMAIQWAKDHPATEEHVA